MKVRLMGMFLMMLAGWTNRHPQDVIVYLKEENKILRAKLGTKRNGFTPGPDRARESRWTEFLRAHQGIGNETVEPPPLGQGEVLCQERRGGLLNF